MKKTNMRIYSIGFSQKSAEEFFNILKNYKIKQLVDIRKNNISQLSGFTKKEDLRFFLREIINVSYIHIPELAPADSIRKKYKETKNWEEYERDFLELLEKRGIINSLAKKNQFISPFVLLCSELKPDKCYRRLVIDLIKEYIYPDAEIIHL